MVSRVLESFVPSWLHAKLMTSMTVTQGHYALTLDQESTHACAKKASWAMERSALRRNFVKETMVIAAPTLHALKASVPAPDSASAMQGTVVVVSFVCL